VETTGDRPDAYEWPAFDAPNILWFFGAFTATGASYAVLTQIHSSARGAWILLASLAFLLAFAAASAGLLQMGWWVPGGVLAAMAVTFVAGATVAFERLIGVWKSSVGLGPIQEFEGSVFAVLVVLAVAGLTAFAIVRFHFILAIVVVATFFAAQLLLPLFVKPPGPGDYATSFVVVGGILILAGLALDAVRARRSAFWWHVVGLTTLSVGLGYHAFRNATWGWVMIFAVGIVVLGLATALVRGTWAVFGVIGFYAPIAHYLNAWLGNLGTAFALVGAGLALVALGVAARHFGGVWPVLRRA
jgi:hypothetical protein